MFEIALFQPEIPPNTGNIIRLCAATGSRLHLIAPLGFALDDRRLRRAGLDYHEYADVRVHASLAALREALPLARIFALSRHAERGLHGASFQPGDLLLFGAETHGLPPEIRATLPSTALLRIPMRAGIRSLNLANAVAITLYEALRQCHPDAASGAL